MAVKAHSRGHLIQFDGTAWKYVDTGGDLEEMRRCKKCGEEPTVEGHDACVGVLAGISSACCGHGIEAPYQVAIAEEG